MIKCRCGRPADKRGKVCCMLCNAAWDPEAGRWLEVGLHRHSRLCRRRAEDAAISEVEPYRMIVFLNDPTLVRGEIDQAYKDLHRNLRADGGTLLPGPAQLRVETCTSFFERDRTIIRVELAWPAMRVSPPA